MNINGKMSNNRISCLYAEAKGQHPVFIKNKEITEMNNNVNFEQGGSCDCSQRVNHIKCEVKNCYYHGSENVCHASMIEVTPSYAQTENDTACATFRHK